MLNLKQLIPTCLSVFFIPGSNTKVLELDIFNLKTPEQTQRLFKYQAQNNKSIKLR